MDLFSLGVLVAVGLGSGFLAGFLGIGGGVVVIPALVYGVGLPIKLATGISIVEAFFATLSGLFAHRHNRTVNYRLGLALGLYGAVGALLGAVASAYLTNRMLLALYVSLVAGSLLLLLTRRGEGSKTVAVNRWAAAVSGFGVGFVAGLVGVGGGFLLIPLLISVLRVPTRVAVGTTLMVVIMTTFAGATGKIVTGQFDPQAGIPVVVSGVVGAQLGGKVNAKVPARAIRVSLALLLAAITIRAGLDLITS